MAICLPGDICIRKKWRRASDRKLSHKSIWCSISINPCHILSPMAYLRLFFTIVSLCWGAELYCLLSQLYSKTMSGFRSNFLVQVTLSREPWTRFPLAAAAHGPFRDSLQESCRPDRRVRPNSLPSRIHMTRVCLTLLKEHSLYSSDRQQPEGFSSTVLQLPENTHWQSRGMNPIFDGLIIDICTVGLKSSR